MNSKKIRLFSTLYILKPAIFFSILALCAALFFLKLNFKTKFTGNLPKPRIENPENFKTKQTQAVEAISIENYQTKTKKTKESDFVEEFYPEFDTIIFIEIENMKEDCTCTGFVDCVDCYAYLPGGYSAINDFISKNLKYPAAAQENGIEGTVIIRFEVMKIGQIGQVEVQKSVNNLLDNEAVRVINKLPEFVPAMHNCIAVSYWYSVPNVFKLY